ncbi:restriction endonuclease subunit S [uncultured Phascolarctobacterium sp.]|uniref:restriction endonuclease subunit S n=1 Tax=uncultured Phascolarctobacterium sp. TaxID=512296 RepID=UPI0025DC3521|nr:restriction endonuclease subunit S [uncultured Phascolarctobacterium sp.]
MTKLEELIGRLCPDGVEYKTLGDVATISRGGNFQKKDFTEQGKPCIHYGQIYTRYGLFTDKTLTFINDECFAKQKYAEPNDIIMAVTSENIEDICKCVAWLGTEKVAVSGHSAIIYHSLDPKYLAYFFHSQHFFNQKRRLAHGTKVMEVTPDTLKSIQLPVPPLEVQREIVRILDNFTFLSTELAAELAARQKQYEYFREFLISNNKSYPIKALSELGNWSGGKTPFMAEKSFWENGTIPWISSKDMKMSTLSDTQDHITQKALSEASMNLYPANSVAIVTRSGILKHTLPVAYIPFQTTINQDIKILIVNDDILPRYAFHVIQAKGKEILERCKKQGGTVDSLDFQKVLAFKVPVPDKSMQQNLIDKLDRFDTLCNDISNGLPAEIKLLKKQYEYYRDKLLTFKELKKEA